MAITIPTVDEFTESTVMLVMREIAEYICGDNGHVAQINNNDITGFTSSYTNNVLKIDATKGDGSTIPVCNVTIEGGSSTGNPYPTAVSGIVGGDGNITFTITMSSGSPLTTTINMSYFASTEDFSDLQEQITGIKPTVSTNLESSPPTITVSVNGTSSTANLPVSGGGFFTHRETNINAVTSVSNGILTVEKDFLIMYFSKASSSDNVQIGTAIVKAGTYNKATAQTYLGYSLFFLNINNSGEILAFSTGNINFSDTINTVNVTINNLGNYGTATPLESDFDLSSIPRGGRKYAIFT